MICSRCGNANKPNARFCARCGQPLTAGASAAGVQPPGPRAPQLTGMLPANTVLAGRYYVQKRLGQGGMAAVYKAEDARLPGTYWAVKEMSEAALGNPAERVQAIEGFRHEARELASLSHPNIVRVIDFFADAGKYYLVMEYVDGSTLEDLLVHNGSAFQEAQVLAWLRQLCDALHYLHSQTPPIIFRDLKPSNIMVDRNGTVKLIDFGIARRFDPRKPTDTTALGTEGYAAPEQYGKGQTDARSDIYALGVTTHRLLTGFDPSTRPFSIPAVRTLNSQVSPRLAEVIDACVRTEVTQRPQRVADIQRSVAGMLPSSETGSGAFSAPRGGPPPVQTSTRPNTRLIQAAARLSGRQLTTIIGGSLAGLVLATWLFAPWIEANFPALWYEVPAFMIAGPLAYAASRRVGPAFVTQLVVTVVVFATSWMRFGTWTSEPWSFLLGAILSAVVYEISFFLLDHQTTWSQLPDAWKRELAWFAATAVLATVFFYVPWYPVRFQGSLWVWINTAVVGAAGWFLGDLVHQGMAQSAPSIGPSQHHKSLVWKLFWIMAIVITIATLLYVLFTLSNVRFAEPPQTLTSNWLWLIVLVLLLSILFNQRKTIQQSISRLAMWLRRHFLLPLILLSIVALVLATTTTPIGHFLLNTESAKVLRQFILLNQGAVTAVILLGVLVTAAWAYRNIVANAYKFVSTTALKPPLTTRRLNPIYVPLTTQEDIQQSLIVTDEINALVNRILTKTGGKYILSGYGRFGATTTINEIARVVVEKARRENHSVLFLNFSISPNTTASYLCGEVQVNGKDIGSWAATPSQRVAIARRTCFRHIFSKQQHGLLSQDQPFRFQFIPTTVTSPRNSPIIQKATTKLRSSLGRDSDAHIRHLPKELEDYIRRGEGSSQLLKILSTLNTVPEVPSRVIVAFDKITDYHTLQVLSQMDLVRHPDVVVFATARQERMDQWNSASLDTLSFEQLYVPCTWAGKYHNNIDEAIRRHLPNKEIPSSMPDKKTYQELRYHLQYRGRGSLGEIHEILGKPLYIGEPSTEHIVLRKLQELADFKGIQHDAWLERLIDLNWQNLLSGLIDPDRLIAVDRARIGVYSVLDWVREREANKFRKAELINWTTSVMPRLLSGDDHVRELMLNRLLRLLTLHNYLCQTSDHYYQRRWGSEDPPAPVRQLIRVAPADLDRWIENDSLPIHGKTYELAATGAEGTISSLHYKKSILCICSAREDEVEAMNWCMAKLREASPSNWQFSAHNNLDADELQTIVGRDDHHILLLVGHGEPTGHFHCYDRNYRCQKLTLAGLSSLFNSLSKLECVVINSCSSQHILSHSFPRLACVIATSTDISLEASVYYSVQFIKSVGAGKSYRDAHRSGVNALQLVDITTHFSDAYAMHS